eukprot:Hpha_TRINITY_DN15885_c0_g5::TRINITY_DN15885_c0_g5_i3::g.189508::m.189508
MQRLRTPVVSAQPVSVCGPVNEPHVSPVEGPFGIRQHGEVWKHDAAPRRLGRGGCSVVSTAHVANDYKAVKHTASVQEVAILQKLHHRHIITCLAAAPVDGGISLLMEYQGRDLDVLCRTPVPVEIVCELMTGINRAVFYMHGKGIMHRDIKPANIMVHFVRQELKLGDFGNAVVYSDRGEAKSICWRAGTLGFIAPECYDSRCKETPARDIFSMAVCYKRLYQGPELWHADVQKRLQSYAIHRDARCLVPSFEPRTEAERKIQQMLEPDPLKRPLAFELLLTFSTDPHKGTFEGLEVMSHVVATKEEVTNITTSTWTTSSTHPPTMCDAASDNSRL